MNTHQKLRTFDLIREAVLPEYRDRVNEYLSLYEEALHSENAPAADIQASAQQRRGYLRGLNTTRVLGMALAAKRKGEKRRAVAIIGDGAMTAGMAFEALNNAGVSDSNLLVILNDNDMSISPPVGALNRYLAQLMSGQFYAKARDMGKSVLKQVPPLLELAKRLEQSAKGMVVPATLFENFGFNYIGPIDGHDLDSLIPTLENIKGLEGPQFLHVVTKKGWVCPRRPRWLLAIRA